MKDACLKFQRQIEDLVTGVLQPADSQKLQEHINQCPACSQYHQELLGDEQLLVGFCEAMAPSISALKRR